MALISFAVFAVVPVLMNLSVAQLNSGSRRGPSLSFVFLSVECWSSSCTLRTSSLFARVSAWVALSRSSGAVLGFFFVLQTRRSRNHRSLMFASFAFAAGLFHVESNFRGIPTASLISVSFGDGPCLSVSPVTWKVLFHMFVKFLTLESRGVCGSSCRRSV